MIWLRKCLLHLNLYQYSHIKSMEKTTDDELSVCPNIHKDTQLSPLVASAKHCAISHQITDMQLWHSHSSMT